MKRKNTIRDCAAVPDTIFIFTLQTPPVTHASYFSTVHSTLHRGVMFPVIDFEVSMQTMLSFSTQKFKFNDTLSKYVGEKITHQTIENIKKDIESTVQAGIRPQITIN